jgi:hypothetical protein
MYMITSGVNGLVAASRSARRKTLCATRRFVLSGLPPGTTKDVSGGSEALNPSMQSSCHRTEQFRVGRSDLM